MAARVFINYRRDDSMGTAGRLHDRLARVFGRKNLFMDVDTIPAGVDFVEYLNTQVAKCDIFLAVIGPHWLDAKDDVGRRRIENPDDFVTIEIAAALARDIRVIPVLVDGAHMPKAGEVPERLRPLVRRNAVEVRNSQFGRDAQVLAAKIREGLKRGRAGQGRWVAAAASLVALLLAGWIGLYQLGVPVWIPWASGAAQSNGPEKSKGDEDARRIAEAKAAADAEAKRRAEEAEQQRLAALKAEKERADAEAKRRAEEAQLKRLAALKAEKERADAEAKRQAEEAERKRLAALKAEQERADAEAKRQAQEAEQKRLAALKAEKEWADADARRRAEEPGKPQQIPLVYSAWIKLCGKNPQDPNAKEPCQTMKEAHMESGQFVAAAALIEQAGEQKKILRLILPNRLLMPPGTRVTVDANPPSDGPFITCAPEYCMAQHEVTKDFVTKLKAGQTLQIEAINDQKQTVSYLLPLAGFAKAYDGPPEKGGPNTKSIPASVQAVLQGDTPPAVPAREPQQIPGIMPQSPQIPLVYSAWVKLCRKNPQDPNAKELCQTMKEGHRESGQFVAAAALIEMAGGQKKLLQLILPTQLLMPPGTRVTIDSNPPSDGPFIICAPEFCMAQHEVTDDFVRKLKGGQTLQIQAINDQKQTVSYLLPLTGFGKAHDGPPTDPKVLEEQRKEQQKKMENELLKRGEEAQKKMQAPATK
jgi:invasion protein IalB